MVAKISRNLRVGDPLEQKQDGADQFNRPIRKVLSYIESDRTKAPFKRGRMPEGARFQKGYWIRPTVFGDVHRDADRARRNLWPGAFGPELADSRSEIAQMPSIRPYRRGLDT